MTATSREQLIAEWRERLAAAETAPAEPTTRPAWLVRVKIRLYRFLLSLYGDGDWSASPQQATEPPSLVFDSSDASALEGKPAKDEERIRAALTAVASAKANVPELGPLADGLPADSWVVAATTKHHWLAREAFQLLRNNGLHPRLRDQGRESRIEVQAGERSEAFALIGDWRSKVRPTTAVVRIQHDRSWQLLVILAFVPFAAGLALVLGILLQSPDMEYIVPDFYPLVWCGVLLIWVLAFLAGFRSHRFKRRKAIDQSQPAKI
jgi:hypothetical protein